MMVMLDCRSVLSALVFVAISFRRVLSVMVMLDCRSVLSALVFAHFIPKGTFGDGDVGL